MTDTYRPQVFEEYIGQPKAKRLLALHIAAALIEGRQLDHILLTGDPGLGKSSLANVVANELRQPFIETTMPFDGPLLRQLDGWWGVLFIDEVQGATKGEQDELLKLLEAGWMHSRKQKRTVKPDALCIIVATTEPGRLEDTFKQRFPIKIDLVDYSPDDLVAIVAQKAEMLGCPPLGREDAIRLATAVAGSPREIKNLMIARKAVIVAHGQDPTVDELFDYCLMDPDGLQEAHKKLLRTLDQTHDGRLGLDGLRNILGLASTREVYERERLLLRLGYIERTPAGRCITSAGHRRIVSSQVGAKSQPHRP